MLLELTVRFKARLPGAAGELPPQIRAGRSKDARPRCAGGSQKIRQRYCDVDCVPVPSAVSTLTSTMCFPKHCFHSPASTSACSWTLFVPFELFVRVCCSEHLTATSRPDAIPSASGVASITAPSPSAVGVRIARQTSWDEENPHRFTYPVRCARPFRSVGPRVPSASRGSEASD